MLRTMFWFTYFWLYKLYSLPKLIHVNSLQGKGDLQGARQKINQTTYHWARSLVNLTGSKVELKGLDNIPHRNVLFVSNHQGNFDIPLLIGYIEKPKGFIAKVELKKIPIINRWMEKIHCVFIDRNNIRQSVKAIRAGTELLKAGKSMVLFPEGTRSRSATLGDFKPGGMRLALKSGVPIVPVTIDGSYRILEQNNFLIKPTLVKITISPPIYVDQLTKKEQADLTGLVRDVIAQNLQTDE